MFRILISRISVIALIVLLVAGFPNYMIQEAYAVTFATAVADDPDNDVEGLNVNDTITLTWLAATNATGSGTLTSAEVLANFTSANSDLFDAGTYTGSWNGDSTVLTITVTSTSGISTLPV
ncbi:MAG: hypothetical protein IIC07_03975, partial [Proteobacteria bacterium]|nr:hypothetical protein [Pseudomonadota bacterium]